MTETYFDLFLTTDSEAHKTERGFPIINSRACFRLQNSGRDPEQSLPTSRWPDLQASTGILFFSRDATLSTVFTRSYDSCAPRCKDEVWHWKWNKAVDRRHGFIKVLSAVQFRRSFHFRKISMCSEALEPLRRNRSLKVLEAFFCISEQAGK